MCGRYKRRSDKQAIATALHVDGDLGSFILAPDDDIRPSTLQPMVLQNKETGARDLVQARWGFLPPGYDPHSKPARKTPINARAEGVNEPGMWKRAFEKHRCLVPADSFFEWKKIRPKDNPKYEFELQGGQPFAFAGLWGAWKHPDTGDWLQSFTIITTDANELMEPVHTRMPVILHPKDYDRWLSIDETDQPPIDLLRPFESEAMLAQLTGNRQDEMFAEPNSR